MEQGSGDARPQQSTSETRSTSTPSTPAESGAPEAARAASAPAAAGATSATSAVGAAKSEAKPPTPSAVVPIPGSPRQDAPRLSFWRRLALRGGASPAHSDERVMARLDVIDSRLTATEQSLANRIERLDQRFTEVWEVEEQLSQLSELVELCGELRDQHAAVEKRVRGLGRRLTTLAVLAALLLATGVLLVVAG